MKKQTVMKEIIIGATTYFVHPKSGTLYYDRTRRNKVSSHMFLKPQYEQYLEQLQKIRLTNHKY